MSVGEKGISKLSCASVSKRVMVQNLNIEINFKAKSTSNLLSGEKFSTRTRLKQKQNTARD